MDRILELPFDNTPRVVKLSPGAKLVFKEWFDKLAEQKNNGGNRFAGLATKMDRYCGRMALGIEIMKYGCKESELLDISEDSMRCSIAIPLWHSWHSWHCFLEGTNKALLRAPGGAGILTKAKCGSKEPQGSFGGRAPANNAKNAKSATIEKK